MKNSDTTIHTSSRRVKFVRSPIRWSLFQYLFPDVYAMLVSLWDDLRTAEELYMIAQRQLGQLSPTVRADMSDKAMEQRLALAAGRPADAKSQVSK